MSWEFSSISRECRGNQDLLCNDNVLRYFIIHIHIIIGLTFKHVRRCVERPWLFLRALLQEGHIMAIMIKSSQCSESIASAIDIKSISHMIKLPPAAIDSHVDCQ